MGQVLSYGLTQHDVAELIEHTKGLFSQAEIEGLYKRFRQLDKGQKGFLTASELSGIPELSINPLAKRISHLYEGANFKEFLGLLCAYSAKADRETKLRHMFRVYDVDGDGELSVDDVELMLRTLAGSAVSEEQLQQLVAALFQQVGVCGSHTMDFKTYSSIMGDTALDHMRVDMPTAD